MADEIADEIVASIHDVQLAENGRYVVIVRVLEGTITPGAGLTAVRSPDGEERPVDLRVTKIWRYERETDIIDPPHAGKLELQGDADLPLSPGSLLVRARQAG